MATTNINGVEQEEEEVVMVMVPLPEQGHLQSLLELCRRILSSSYSSYSSIIHVYYVGSPAHIRQAQSRAHGWNPLAIPNLHFSAFQTTATNNNPPPPPDTKDNYPSHLIPSFYAAMELREPVAKLVKNLANKAKRVVVIHDILMAWVVQDVIPSIVPNVECYCLHTVSALYVCSTILQENLNEDEVTVPTNIQALLEEVASIEGGDAPALMLKYVERQVNCGVIDSRHIFSTCRTLEGIYLDLIQQSYLSDVDYRTWGLGLFMNPLEMEELIHHERKDSIRHHLLQWLDKQEPNSVILVSFGSTVSFSDEQIKELAIGLEKSQQKFIWFLKEADRGEDVTVDGFADHQKDDNIIRRFTLPDEEYEKRVEGRGILEWGWGPQLEVLDHPSTGGFMSHCGWNSCLESISCGVPIAAWPMHTDQPRNALFMTKSLKISILVREWACRNELVKAQTVKIAVQTLMASPEGETLRQNAAQLRDAVKASFMDGGATHKEIESFMSYITR